MLKKSEINAILKQIKVRKRQLLDDLLSAALEKESDPTAVKAILDTSVDKEDTLNRLEATAELVLSRYHGKSAKGRIRRLSVEDMRDDG